MSKEKEKKEVKERGLCRDCAKAVSVRHATKLRCTEAAPVMDAKDKEKKAMVSPSDGCTAGFQEKGTSE